MIPCVRPHYSSTRVLALRETPGTSYLLLQDMRFTTCICYDINREECVPYVEQRDKLFHSAATMAARNTFSGLNPNKIMNVNRRHVQRLIATFYSTDTRAPKGAIFMMAYSRIEELPKREAPSATA